MEDAPPDELRRRAEAEGHIVLYSDSSRAIASLDSFMRAFPGIGAEGRTFSSQDVFLRLGDDLRVGEATADLYLVSDPPRTLGLVADRQLWNYVPAELTALLPQDMVEPLLTHHWTAVLWIYSNGLLREPPIHNWWDVTLPQWRGHIVLPDPILHERTLYLFATLVQHSAELQAAYRARFGHDLALDADCPNAGYQWIKDLLANQPVLLPGDAEVAQRVGDPKASEPLLGLCSYEQFAKVAQDMLHFVPLPDLAPAAGMRWRTYVGIVDHCEHPWAAKLLARWLMGDSGGGQGYAPWYDLGLYPARTDTRDPPGTLPRSYLAERLWEPDYHFITEHLLEVRDHVATNIGHPVGGR
jgi:iron(III) transport system substrate-binding protein